MGFRKIKLLLIVDRQTERLSRTSGKNEYIFFAAKSMYTGKPEIEKLLVFGFTCISRRYGGLHRTMRRLMDNMGHLSGWPSALIEHFRILIADPDWIRMCAENQQ